jgi:hypothetical protein
MKYLSLHLRARRVPAAGCGAVATSVCTWLGWMLASDSHQVGPELVAVTVMLACVATSVTLAGDDEALDRTAALAWPRVRAVHLLTILGSLLGLFSLTLATRAQLGPFAFVLRDVVGMLGLIALGTVFLGVQRAWFAPVFLSVVAVFWGRPTSHHGIQVLTWMTQPAETRASLITAVALAVTGCGAYVRGRTGLPRTEWL